MKLIALVAVVVGAGADRVTIPPGEEVKGLSKVGIAELLASGSIEDVDATAATEKKDAAAEAKAGKEFQEARKVVQAKQADIAPPTA